MLADYALIIMLVVLVVSTIAGLPMGVAMIASSVLYLFISGRDMGLGAEMVLNGIFGNFAAVAVPLFIFAANIMDAGKISDRLLQFCLALVGRSPGGPRRGAGQLLNLSRSGRRCSPRSPSRRDC